MTEDAAPRITGIHHVSATVTDVEASVAWYQRLFRDPDNIQLEFIALG
jgi:glyoxylase I family protein